ncbi:MULTISPECIES: MBL fold metallo-hydrolase [unclassified Sphingomonas]|uniref:MBL fold metallo-hydrolase n=1 Tax=unclassified Sphingomonas TaxID=196159 RepID=UPI0006F91067|nr:MULTISPECIES: MBL fold metallo-hydrolase [unclassified Sphingomonas]KQX23412.1 MBL fold metallo-hydrolase [Sphingomonas sp. Root1294]KQY68263.1 MBL fold metallo-hydrolase [Sphingomonas sp. Root50]KRB91161.1 MBL fold metallo-hydrolase [Sphingomonas sp. Root720]
MTTRGPTDPVIERARTLIASTGSDKRPVIKAFFDQVTKSVSYVAHDPATGTAAIIDSLLDFDPASGRTSTRSAQMIVDHVREQGLRVDWILETHVHADHLSAACWLQQRLGGGLGIGREISAVQKAFGPLFDAGPDFVSDGSQFDRLFEDGEPFAIGTIDAMVLHLPGHTPACVGYVIGDALFVGDTIFMPDFGTARADFPGGDAAQLYHSIQRLFALPPHSRLFLCHDYLTAGRSEHCWETTIAAEIADNVHVHRGVTEDMFVAMRSRRDAALPMPQLILPSVQVNMRAGDLPPPAANGLRYLKIPLDAF